MKNVAPVRERHWRTSTLPSLAKANMGMGKYKLPALNQEIIMSAKFSGIMDNRYKLYF